MLSVAPRGGSCIDASLPRAGFRPGRRPSFVSAKGPKTIDALFGGCRGDRRQRGAGQLAGPVLSEAEGLRQGPPDRKRFVPETEHQA